MADINSSSYQVVKDTKDGDQLVLVRNGQLKKMVRSALIELIEDNTASSILDFDDSPGTYVGQAGKTLAVNSTQDGMEFVTNTLSPTFATLPDVDTALTGNGLKYLRINSAGDYIEYVTPDLTEIDGAISDYSDLAGNFVIVNSAENGITAVDFNTDDFTYAGFFDYSHSGTTQAYTSGSGYVKLLNDAAGAQTTTAYSPIGVDGVWDDVSSLFDWSDLSLGDMVDLRIDLTVVTTATNQEVDVDLYMADGSGNEYSIPFSSNLFKSSGTHQISRYNGVYMGNADTLNNGAYFRILSDADATITVSGWYVKVVKRGL